MRPRASIIEIATSEYLAHVADPLCDSMLFFAPAKRHARDLPFVSGLSEPDGQPANAKGVTYTMTGHQR